MPGPWGNSKHQVSATDLVFNIHKSAYDVKGCKMQWIHTEKCEKHLNHFRMLTKGWYGVCGGAFRDGNFEIGRRVNCHIVVAKSRRIVLSLQALVQVQL